MSRVPFVVRTGFFLGLALKLLSAGRLVAAEQASPPQSFDQLAALLSDVTKAAAHRYAARDDRGRTLDCLKIFELGPGDYLGIYHAMEKGVFRLHAAHSTNLLDWQHRVELDAHASQGALWREKSGGFYLAYEHDVPKAVNIRLRHYANLASLWSGRFAREVDLPRTLAPTAEGTPSFDRVEEGSSPDQARVDLRIHYYREMKVDRAARGTLTGFTNWHATVEPAVDTALEARGVRGNIGDRDHIEFQGRSWLIQEGQLVRDDWASWRIYLLDPSASLCRELPIRTHRGSTSFANPSVTRLRDPQGRRIYAVTLFLPTQGNARGEIGSLIYLVADPSAASR